MAQRSAHTADDLHDAGVSHTDSINEGVSLPELDTLKRALRLSSRPSIPSKQPVVNPNSDDTTPTSHTSEGQTPATVAPVEAATLGNGAPKAVQQPPPPQRSEDKEAIEALQQQLKALEQEKSRLESKNREHERDVARLQQDNEGIDTLQQQLEALQHEKTMLESRNREHERNVARLQQDNEAVAKSKAALLKTTEEANNRIAALERQVATLQSENAALQAKQAGEDQSEAMSKLRREMETLRQEKTALEQREAHLIEEATAKDTEAGTQQGQLQQAKATLREREAEVAELRDQVKVSVAVASLLPRQPQTIPLSPGFHRNSGNRTVRRKGLKSKH